MLRKLVNHSEKLLFVASLGIFNIFVYTILISGSSFLEDTNTDWDLGIKINMTIEGTGTNANLTSNWTNGGFLSQIFDSNLIGTSWTNITYSLEYPYGEELPSNYQDLSEMNMTSNILLMHFNNLTGYENDTHIYDFSGIGNNGTAYNGTAVCGGSASCPHYNLTNKKLGVGAMQFDGVNDYIDFGTGVDISNAPLTINVWIYPNSHTHQGQLVTSPQGQQGYTLALTSSGTLSFGKNEVDEVLSTDTISDNNWTMVTAVYSTDDKITFYKNGINDSGGQLDYSTIFAVGGGHRFGWQGVAGYAYHGLADEVAIFNRSLSADEIKNLYYRGAARLNVSVRSCDDSSCSGETWNTTSNNASFGRAEILTNIRNRYFQYMFNYTTDNSSKIIRINNLTIGYENYYPPSINFTLPTPPNSTTTSNTSIEINISIQDADDLDEVKYNWNGTNFTIYNDSLVLMMNFDNVSALGESSVSNFTADVSGYGNNGNCSGMGVGCNYTMGKYGKGISFDGVNDYVDIFNDVSINITEDITLSAWVYLNNKPTNTRIPLLAKYYAAGNQRGYALEVQSTISSTGCDNLPAFTISSTGTTFTGGSRCAVESLNTNQWYHIVGVFNAGNKMEIYINGINKTGSWGAGSQPSGIFGNNRNLLIGAMDDDTNKFNGTIDEVRIYNRSLSATEIQQLYMSNLKKYDTDKWELYVNQSKNATAGLDTGIYTYQAFAKDTAGNLNWTELRSITIGGGTCSCPSTNTNWEIDMSNNCILSESCNLGTGNLTFTGTGNFTCNSTFNFTSIQYPSSNQIIYINPNCRMDIG